MTTKHDTTNFDSARRGYLHLSIVLALAASPLLGCEVDDEGFISDTSAAVSTDPVNLAEGMPAIESSTRHADATVAVDGNTDGDFHNGSVTHTDTEHQPWWQVDLQTSQSVGDVVIYNRTDCCSDRLSNFDLLVSNDGRNWQSFPYPGTASAQVTIAVDRTARFVRVQLNGSGALSLAEVQVMSGDGNLSRSMSASQSSTSAGGLASRGVDGNTDGVYNNASVTHTASEYQPWWQVDLESLQSIGDVIVYNRTDSCCIDRLSDFTVQVSADGITWQSFAFAGTASAQETFAVNQDARFVKVQLNGTNPLSLAEVQVLAPVAPSAPSGNTFHIKNVGRNELLNIDDEGSYWPADFRLQSSPDEIWEFQDTAFGSNVKTITTTILPGVCSDGSSSNNCPDNYRLCAYSSGGFRMYTSLQDAWVGTPSSWDAPQCAWIIEDNADGTFKMRNYWLETTYGSYIGYLKCDYSYDCTFDYGSGSHANARFEKVAP